MDFIMPVVLTIFDVIAEMKRKPRTGWVDHGILNPETIWQHSVDVRGDSRKLAGRYLGAGYVDHCGKLGAVHDVIECIVPDITPSMGVSVAQKRELEVMAIEHIGRFSDGGKRIRDLWFEFDEEATTTARFVLKVDKLSVAKVSLRYELGDRCRYSLQPFWDYARKHVEGSPLIEEWERLARLRPVGAANKPLLERNPKPPGTFEAMRVHVLRKIGACGL